MSTTPPGRAASEDGAARPAQPGHPDDSAQRSPDDLQTALESNRRIGIAIGILMTRLRITDEAAFELLRRASNDRNVKLRLVAEEVIYTGTLDR